MSSVGTNFGRVLRVGAWSRYLLPRQADVIFLAIFGGVLLLGPRLMNMDGDLGRHLTIGNFILESGSIPTRDIFSHTMTGAHLTPHEWLAQVLFALSYRAGGLDGVVLLSALVIAATFWLVFRMSLKQSQLLVVSLVMTILAAAAASVHWLARPHIFSMLFTVLWINEMEKWRRNENFRWWSLPLLMLIWVNLHGAFLIGIVIWGIYLVDWLINRHAIPTLQEERRGGEIREALKDRKLMELLFVGLVTVSVTLVNPAGWRIWETTFSFLGNDYLVSHTVEYQSPDFQSSSFWPFLGMVCISILITSLNRRSMPTRFILLLVAWTAFSLVSARNIAIYAVIAGPIVALGAASIVNQHDIFRRFSEYDQRLRRMEQNLHGYLWPVAVTLFVGILVLGTFGTGIGGVTNQFSAEVFPVKAADWLADQPQDKRIFNYFPWGGYLLYRSWPDQLVFIDGQTDFYGESLTREYEKVITMTDGWQDVLDQYEVARVIMPVDSVLAITLMDLEGWQPVYRDGTAAVLDRKP